MLQATCQYCGQFFPLFFGSGFGGSYQDIFEEIDKLFALNIRFINLVGVKSMDDVRQLCHELFETLLLNTGTQVKIASFRNVPTVGIAPNSE